MPFRNHEKHDHHQRRHHQSSSKGKSVVVEPVPESSSSSSLLKPSPKRHEKHEYHRRRHLTRFSSRERQVPSPSPPPVLKKSKSHEKHEHNQRRHHKSSSRERQASPPSPTPVAKPKRSHEQHEHHQRHHHEDSSPQPKETVDLKTAKTPSPSSLKPWKSHEQHDHHQRRQHQSSSKERQEKSPPPAMVQTKIHEPQQHGHHPHTPSSTSKGKHIAPSATWSTCSSFAVPHPRTPTQRPRLRPFTFAHPPTSSSHPQTLGNRSLLEASHHHEHRSSNTWTSSTAHPESPAEDDVIDDRTAFVDEYNRLARKVSNSILYFGKILVSKLTHGSIQYRVRSLIPGDFPGTVVSGVKLLIYLLRPLINLCIIGEIQ